MTKIIDAEERAKLTGQPFVSQVGIVELEPIIRREIAAAFRAVQSHFVNATGNPKMGEGWGKIADSLSPATEAAKLNRCGGCGQPAMLTGRGYNCPAYCTGRFQPTFEKWNAANPIPFQGDPAPKEEKRLSDAEFRRKAHQLLLGVESFQRKFGDSTAHRQIETIMSELGIEERYT